MALTRWNRCRGHLKNNTDTTYDWFECALAPQWVVKKRGRFAMEKEEEEEDIYITVYIDSMCFNISLATIQYFFI